MRQAGCNVNQQNRSTVGAEQMSEVNCFSEKIIKCPYPNFRYPFYGFITFAISTKITLESPKNIRKLAFKRSQTKRSQTEFFHIAQSIFKQFYLEYAR